MNNHLNDITLILQGTTTNKQTLQDLYNEYKDMGFTNIILSSYSQYIPNDFLTEDFTINNDDLFDKFKSQELNFGKNINFHIATTQRGISKSNTKYIMKLRADLFIPHLNDKTEEWIKLINSKDPIPPDTSPLTKKIICVGLNKHKYLHEKWYVCDYWFFGLKEDIKTMWDIPYIYKKRENKIPSEVYLSSQFLNKAQKPLDDFNNYFISSPDSMLNSYNHRWRVKFDKKWVNTWK